MSSIWLKTRRASGAGTALAVLACSVIAPVGSAQDAPDTPSLWLGVSYSGDYRRNTTGGMQTGNAYNDLLDLGATWTTDSLFSAARLTANVSVMYLGGGDGITGKYVGDLQGVNNIEGPQGWRLYESWVEFSFGESSSSVRTGVLDLNAEFDTPVTQGLFSASPFGIGTEFSQTGSNGPGVWPTTGLGIRAAGEVREVLAWRVGAYDGAPGADEDDFTSMELSSDEGALIVGELEYLSDRFNKLALGAWHYTADFERIDAPLQPSAASSGGNYGVYAHLDMKVASIGAVDLNGALRAGTAASEFNTFDQYVGAAVTVSHLWESRPGDTLGLGIAWAHTGDEYRALRSFDGQPATAAETTFELAYRAELAPWLAILPNVQFVSSPGADPSLGDAWVLGLRFEVLQEHSWQLSARHENKPDESYARSKP